MAIRFITDSTADLPPGLRTAWGVQVAPMGAVFDGWLYLQDIDMTLEEFYARLAATKTLPTTTQVNPQTFAGIIAPIVKAGDQAMVFCVSSGLSGTYQSACVAKEGFPEDKVFVVDTNSVTMGAAALIACAARMRDEGATAQDIAREMEELRTRLVLYAIIDDLRYPNKGGRLSTLGARVGGVLDIKPVISIWNGKASIAGLARGLRGAYRWLAERVAKEGIDERCPVVFGNANVPERMPELESTVFPKGCPCHVMRHKVGMVLGTHTGPGAVGLAYAKQKK
jgi:DegV family protein with EDD domain